MVFAVGYEFQFLITISRLLFVFCILLMAVKADENRPLDLKNGVICKIADSTLEIYLVQIVARIQIQKINVTIIEIVLFWLAALIGGIAVHEIYNVVIKHLTNLSLNHHK
jgi:hypothetical protein